MNFSSLSAYEDKQQSKRKEISTRSWFNSPSASPAGAAGGLLLKLGHQGREAAVAKALGSSPSALIRKRSGSKQEPCVTVSHSEADPAVSACEGENPKEGLNTVINGRETREEADEGLKAGHSEKEEGRSKGAVMSLVADYSDSDSDPGQ